MNREDILRQIEESVNRLLAERSEEPILIKHETNLVNGQDLPIDSLDLAVMVTDLQETTGVDPFAEGFQEFQTAGELIDLFSRELRH